MYSILPLFLYLSPFLSHNQINPNDGPYEIHNGHPFICSCDESIVWSEVALWALNSSCMHFVPKFLYMLHMLTLAKVLPRTLQGTYQADHE